MTGREALHEFVEALTDDGVEALLRRLEGELASGGLSGVVSVLEARLYPALAQVWDNEDDAVFDQLRAR